MQEPEGHDSVRRALYVLFARLFAGPPDAELYLRLRQGGLEDLATAQGIDLTSDLVDRDDAEGSALELQAEYDTIEHEASLRASDYEAGSEDPLKALSGFYREHGFRLESGVDLPADHLSVVLGVMAELAEQAEEDGDEARRRARGFLERHLLPWAPSALTEVARAARRRFYRGLAAMLAAYLETERRGYDAA